MRKLLGCLSLLAAAMLTAAGCDVHDDRPRLGEVERMPRLETALPERATLVVKSVLTATVEAMEKADLCAQVRGVVKDIPDDVDIGRLVRKDEPLVTLDIPDIVAERENKKAMLQQAKDLKDNAARALDVARQEVIEAQTQLKRYEADLEKYQLAYERLAKLAASDTVQKQLADEARIARDAAQAARDAQKAQILTKQAKEKAAESELKAADSRIEVAQSEVKKYDVLVNFGTIRAPFDGVITKRWVDRGATVKDNSTPLLTVMRTDTVRVVLDVPQRDVPFIHVAAASGKGPPGNRVTLFVPALQDVAPQGFTGQVTLKASALDPVTRTMRVEVHLPNKTGYLRPQMTGTATVVLGERRNVLTVPSSALVRRGKQVFVYYLADLKGEPPHGVVRKNQVQIGLDDGMRVEIREGLTGNERVIIKGAGVVRTGDRAISAQARVVEVAKDESEQTPSSGP
jgi:HlyD family secretion protein